MNTLTSHDLNVFVHNLRVDMTENTHYVVKVSGDSPLKASDLPQAISRAKRSLRQGDRYRTAKIVDSFGTVVALVLREGRDVSVIRRAA